MSLSATTKLQAVCLTGGIAAGKSRVAKWFEEQGWGVICTDEIVHELYRAGGEMPKLIAQEFGPEVIGSNGDVDRAKLASVVFSNPNALKKLNALVHPVVQKKWKHELDELLKLGKKAMVTIPLAYETGVAQEFQSVWVVACSLPKQYERLLERGISKTKAEGRIASQMPLQRKIDLADNVIWNNDSWEITIKQLQLLR